MDTPHFRKFSREEQLLHTVVLHANDAPARGLFDGQMGLVLVLSEYARTRRAPELRTAIRFLLDQVLEHLDEGMPLDFANGLTGIGWGVEYLLARGFQRGSGADICAAIDRKLMERDLLRQTDLSLDTGLEGWLHYLAAHVQGARREGREVTDAAYLAACRELCGRIAGADVPPTLRRVAATLAGLLEGRDTDYTFHLGALVLPAARKEKNLLSLRAGMAGRLLLLLENAYT